MLGDKGMHAHTHPGATTAAAGPVVMGQARRGGTPMRPDGDGHVPPYSASQPADHPATPRRAPVFGSGQHRAGVRPTDPAATQEQAAFLVEQHRQRVWAGIRHEVVHRLVGMNLRHAIHAWSVRRDRPVAPWAVGFLYAYPTGTVYD